VSFSSRQTIDLASMFNAVTAREDLIFPVAVTLEDEAGNQIAITAIQSDVSSFSRTSNSRSQKRTFRVLESVIVRRNYKIIQTTNGVPATWWVKDVVDDHEGVKYVKCERPVAKG